MSFPFRVTELGAVTSARTQAVQEQLEQLLLTLPGERVNRPDFGCGIQRLVFAESDPLTLSTAEFVVATAIRQYLRALVTLDAVRVSLDDTTLYVDVLYTLVGSGQEAAATVSAPLEVTS